MQPSLSFDDFCSSTQDSRQWYDMLPGDVQVVGIPPEPSLKDCIVKFISQPELVSETLCDVMAAHLLNGGGSSISHEDLRRCSEQASRVMAQHLTALGSRSMRMRAQRVHYFIQAMLAEETPIRADNVLQSEAIMDASKPWDYLPHATGTWWLSCDVQNIHHRNDHGAVQHYTRGLPTQLDALGDDWVSIGSLYSNGCTITNGDVWLDVPHSAPVLLMWETNGARYFIDHFAAIWQENPRTKIAQLPCAQVHFARHHQGKLYGLNNGEFGAIWIYDTHSGSITHQTTMPVWVANDIAFTQAHFYLVDKQQGYVFKFNQHWQFEEKILAFGRGTGRLLDPVSIRVVGDASLHVISWLNGKHSVLTLF